MINTLQQLVGGLLMWVIMLASKAPCWLAPAGFA